MESDDCHLCVCVAKTWDEVESAVCVVVHIELRKAMNDKVVELGFKCSVKK